MGNDGTTVFKNGNIVLNSGGRLSSSQYMLVLIRFQSNLFNTKNVSHKSFDDIYESAISDVNPAELEKKSKSVNVIMCLIIVLLDPFSIFVCFFVFAVKRAAGSGRRLQSKFNLYCSKLPSNNHIDYYREIPCNNDLERAYWVAYHYHVVPVNTLKKSIIGAILLKWIKAGFVTVLKTEKSLFSFKDNNYAIDLNNMQSADNEIEDFLLARLKEASGLNHILEAKEFKKWCKRNSGKMESWFFGLDIWEQHESEKKGLIVEACEEVTTMFGKKKMFMSKRVNQKLREEAIQLKGLKKFLLHFSTMPEREYFEVHIWEEYLIYAQLLGIANKVQEQFSKLYPDFNGQSKLNIATTAAAVSTISHVGYKGYQAGRRISISTSGSTSSSSHDYSGRSRDSGGGGRSYSSGGRSAGGSSGGGFR